MEIIICLVESNLKPFEEHDVEKTVGFNSTSKFQFSILDVVVSVKYNLFLIWYFWVYILDQHISDN